MDNIRHFMGVCPQHNILYDQLTVEEHLQLFGVFKGMTSDELETEIPKILQDVDLTEKTDVLAKELSGG